MCARSSTLRLLPILVLILMLAGCSNSQATTPKPNYGATATPYGQKSVPTPALAPPPGWSAVLPKISFANTSTRGKLVASMAKPGRIIGCGLTAPIYAPQPPAVVLSDDSGNTWQTLTIPHMPSAISCNILADTLEADTFLVWFPNDRGTSTFYTRDAGKSWRTLPPQPASDSGPSSNQFSTLAGDVLYDWVGQTDSSVVRMQFPLVTGVWQKLDGALLAGSPTINAADLDNHLTVYGMKVEGPSQVLYRSDDGGLSWRRLRELPGWQSGGWERVGIWVAHHHQVFLKEEDGASRVTQMLYSADGGDTWGSITMHSTASAEKLFISPDGHVITQTEQSASDYTLYALDPARGTFTTIGAFKMGPGAPVTALTDGPTAALIYGNLDHTWRMALNA